MATFTAWSDIYAIKHLVITTTRTHPQTFVYGNGINQTEVIIYMNAINQFNEEITDIPSEMLLKHSLLLDFIKGEVLLDATTVSANKREDIWSYSRKNNGYNNEPPSPDGFESQSALRPLDINAEVASFFVMCGPNSPARTLLIAVQVSLTHPRAPRNVYQTSITGTPGFESYITATALDPIDYSRAENRRVQLGASITERNNIRWLFKPRVGSIESHNNGTRKRHIVRLSPINGGQFHRVENLSGTITPDDLQIKDVTWDGQITEGFGQLLAPYPIAVLGTSARFMPYEVNYWYLNPSHLEIANDYLGLEATSALPASCKVSAELRADEVLVPDDPGMLVCYKFSVWDTNHFPYGWSSTDRYGLSLKLTDRYGNSGYVSLTLDTADWFDAPRIL